MQTDGVVEVCQLCAPCTRSTRHAQELRSAARLLDTVEPELVPTVLQVQDNKKFVCFEIDNTTNLDPFVYMNTIENWRDG